MSTATPERRTEMTIALLEGGLGRQMFTYAAARRLAARHGSRVALDPRSFRHHPKHQIELHHFALDAVLLSPVEAEEASGRHGTRLPVVRPQTSHVDRRLLDLDTADVLVMGSYSSQDYFHDVEDELRTEFHRLGDPTRYAAQTQAHLDDLVARGFEPVAVHVRRGDRVTEPHLAAAYGTCTDEYYANALATIERLVANPWFVVFSDDPAWVTEHWAGERRTITAPPADTPAVEDMLLMAGCRHQVIANSAYSWWGAWLGKHAEQVVIGPRPFLADRRHNSEDVLPREWLSLASIPRPAV